MKKVVYLLILPLLFIATNTKAQSFTVEHDTVKSTVTGYTELYNYINNTSANTIDVNWKILSETLPDSWEKYALFGLCDNVTCYDTGVLRGVSNITDTFMASKKCLFKVQIDGSDVNVTPGGPYFVTAEISDLSGADTVVFELYKFPASVSKTNAIAKDEVTLYPNPAGNFVNVTFNKDANIKTIAIYNLIGKQVAAYRNSNNSSARLDLEKIPSGVYFVRLMDSNNQVVATRRFTHQ